MKNLFPYLLALGAIAFVGCGDDSLDIIIDNPINYEFIRDGQSTVSF